jgi:hypothetical protein
MSPKSVLDRSMARLLLSFLAITFIFAASSSAATQADPERPTRLSSAISRIEKTLRVRDGVVVIDQRRAAAMHLTRGEKSFGTLLVEHLNARIRKGDLRVGQDLKVVRAGAGEILNGKDVSCDTNWWGESCNIDAATTQDIDLGLQAGDSITTICGVIPVVGEFCDLIELIGALPLEAELAPCVGSNDGSVFHVTWVGTPWFTCQ